MTNQLPFSKTRLDKQKQKLKQAGCLFVFNA